MDSELQINNNDRVDLDMVMGLIGNALLDEGGIEQINGIMQQANEPAEALANVTFQLVSTTVDQLVNEGLEVSETIWAARGGVVDQTIAEIAQVVMGIGEGQLSPDVMEEARDIVMDMLNQQLAPQDGMGMEGGLLGGPGPDMMGMPEAPMGMGEERAMMGLLGG